MVGKFSNLNLKYEKYLLHNFNINLLQNGNYILNWKRSTISYGSVHTLINRCKGFCQRYSLEQLTTCLLYVT